MESIKDLIKWAEAELVHSDIESFDIDTELLFMDSFGAHREDIYIMKSFKPTIHCIERFRHRVKLRASRYPLQYILKGAEFMGLHFKLKEGVFIPRPETELLVERVLEYIKSTAKIRGECQQLDKTISEGVNILEIGTGCGNLAISLTKNVTDCKIIASDISDKTLRVAVGNARLHNVSERIEFIKSNFFDNISFIYYNYFDIILSNPPYVRRKEIGSLQPEISYEDIMALDGGEDGLYFYRRILNEGAKYLKGGGIFAFEIGYDQRNEIARLIRNDSTFFDTTFFRDYSGHDRVMITKYRRGDRIG